MIKIKKINKYVPGRKNDNILIILDGHKTHDVFAE
jgi:hypothetical protein